MANLGPKRRLAAIFSADAEGFSRLMGANEEGTLALLVASRALIDVKLAEHGGRVAGSAGDSVLAEFTSAVQAVACAVALQRELAERNAALSEDRRMAFRIGINLGDVIVEGDTIFGDGVNVAARLEALAEPGGVCVSRGVYDQVKGKLPLSFAYLGEQRLKNIAEPVRAYRVDIVVAADAAVGQGSGSDRSPFDHPVIAVLPFVNMSGDAEQEYFSDGITEDIITELARFKSLAVIARNSSFAFKGKSVDVKEIGQRLGARFIVEGSVRKAGNRIRVTAQLVQAGTGEHIWAERYDRGLEDVFAVQDELTQAIVGALPVRLSDAALARSRRAPPESLTAYDCFLRGRWAGWNGSAAEALEFLRRAISIDAGLASAHAQLAAFYAYGVWTLGIEIDDLIVKARRHAELALSLDGGDPFIQTFAAMTYALCGDHDLAGILSERAIAQNPNDIYAIHTRGVVLTALGDAAKGLEWILRVESLDPISPESARHDSIMEGHYALRRYDEVVATFQRWRAPSFHAYPTLAAAHPQAGRAGEARAAAAAYLKRLPPGYDRIGALRAYARMYKRPEDKENWLTGFRKAGLLD
ncbi:MAG: adenylate/guanylate cyclase domain-containing protein [Alphaproteobacteria bacterium]